MLLRRVTPRTAKLRQEASAKLRATASLYCKIPRIKDKIQGATRRRRFINLLIPLKFIKFVK